MKRLSPRKQVYKLAKRVYEENEIGGYPTEEVAMELFMDGLDRVDFIKSLEDYNNFFISDADFEKLLTLGDVINYLKVRIAKQLLQE